ncbi:MAG: carboxylate--amine ligase [Actinobacteria bacterium 69-20]|jgi:proteasome assembly chaperone (PAC2) family protein|nr:PAC2 family protein [Actinomycetota bacterium]OJV26030.1 MAG: carboxylate--amine ligase [Actinobacteria bacterium 69-20]
MRERPLRDPVMVAAFEGWNDAADAASAAVEHLSLTWDAEEFAEFDPERFYDFQVSRPVVTIRDGVTRDFSWPTTRITACYLPHAPHDVLLVHGIEPSFAWRTYCRALIDVALSADVSMIVTLGALLADVAHTTPIQITGSAHDAPTADRLGLAASSYEGPTGITSAVQVAAVAAGIPAITLWAAVPHYVSDPPSPKVTLALLRTVEEALDIEVPVGGLPEQADEWVEQVTQLAAEDSEISDYVRALQERDDEAVAIEPMSGDTIAEEFQRYLRRRRPKPGSAR